MTDILQFPDDIEGLKASTEMLKRSMPHLIEHAQLVAHLTRVRYEALTKEGFQPSEALELCKDPLT